MKNEDEIINAIRLHCFNCRPTCLRGYCSLWSIVHGRPSKGQPWEMIPKKYQGLFQKCMEGQATPLEAIWFHCLECMEYDPEQVLICSCASCELYPYRNAASSVEDQRTNS